MNRCYAMNGMFVSQLTASIDDALIHTHTHTQRWFMRMYFQTKNANKNNNKKQTHFFAHPND